MMRKKLLFFAAVLMPVSFLSGEKPKGISAYEAYRQQAIAINDLAGNIQSLDDSRKLVDRIAAEFSDELPPKWVTRKTRTRIAQAEYESATNPAMLIPEQRVADAWNRFVREIEAGDDMLVTAAEIHYLRDASYVSGRMFWMQDNNRSIWTMPNIYAVEQNGKVADGCRALEALRLMHDLAYFPEDIPGAREMARKGVLFSDKMKQANKTPHRSEARLIVSAAPKNPLLEAGERYVNERGQSALRRAIENLVDDMFPE
jgi:hypothetical protein